MSTIRVLNERGKAMRRKPFPVVAIAEDDLDDQFLLKCAFEECRPDLKIHFYDDAEDLLDYLNRSARCNDQESTPDLIIIDFHLPKKDGFDLIEEIKANPDLKSIPLIVITGSAADTDIKQCYDLGANTVITKPNSFDELVRALKTLCDYWFGPIRM